MNRGTSLYLDAVRFLAAFIVFMDHYAAGRISGGLFHQLMSFGGEAVDVFFVLSGYVIGYATDTRERSARAYAINRAARIYSVALPALVLTFVLDRVGLSLQPDLYLLNPNFRSGNEIWQFASSLLFINQVWWANTSPGTLLAYWSLGFEVWYYVIFGMAAFASGRWRIVGIAALLLLVGPKIVAMFPLWLMGLFAYRATARYAWPAWLSSLLFYGSLILWVAYEMVALRTGRLDSLAANYLPRWGLIQDYFIALLFAVNLLGVSAIAPVFARVPAPVTGAIRWVAGATFSLYLLHQPLMMVIVAMLPWAADRPATRIIVWVGTLAGVFAVAQVTERRKNAWRAVIASLLPQAAHP